MRPAIADVSDVAQTPGGAFVILSCILFFVSRDAHEEDPYDRSSKHDLARSCRRNHSSDPTAAEKAQIAIPDVDGLQHIRIDNTLTMKNGDRVSLKKGAVVKVTIEA